MFSDIDKLNEDAWNLRNSNTSEALRLCQNALLKAQDQNYTRGMADSLVTMGFCQFRLGNYQEALVTAAQALELFEALSDLAGRQKTLNTMGIIYGQSGDLASALKTFLQVQKLCQNSGDQDAEANALNNIGIIYKMLGEPTNALEYHLKSLPLYEATGLEQGALRTLQNIGTVYDDIGNHQEALKYYEKSLEKQNKEEDPVTYGLTLSNIGICHRKLGIFDKAFEYQDQSLKIMERIQDRLGESFVLDEIGLSYFDMKEPEKAIDYLEKSLAIKHAIGDRKHTATTCLHLGAVYLELKEGHKAIKTFQEALSIVETIQAKNELYKSHHGLAKAYKLIHSHQLAFEHLSKYTELREAFHAEVSDQRFHALRVSYEVEQAEKEREIYRLKSVALAQANMELTQLKNQLEKLANEDPLTGLYNRRVFNEKLETEFKRVQRFDGPMSVMICDIDSFKKVNDTFSHAVGDEVLKTVAKIFKTNIRSIDTVARYGGEEFVILLPETQAKEAYTICDRLRQLVETYPWHKIHKDLSITMSMGVCDDTHSKDAHEMISKADHTLYAVKHNGKNHVRIWDSQQASVLA
ncbi:MAG: tetratricopeptide repeat protein [Trueperaceae bacterium]|nr:tetratricopeptide repeat protein [Trueperaceae bacterium]